MTAEQRAQARQLGKDFCDALLSVATHPDQENVDQLQQVSQAIADSLHDPGTPPGFGRLVTASHIVEGLWNPKSPSQPRGAER